MIDAGDERTLRQFARRHHVHYTVEPDWVSAGGRWLPVGFVIRLFAVHPRGARALPACPKSRALAASLRSFARSVFPECRSRARLHVEPFSAALYDSREVPGADEVALTIRLLHHRERYTEPVDESERRCLKAIRERLKLVSVPER